MKKNLTLRDVNSKGWHITITDTGYEIISEAGSAQYDVFGARTTVNGIPEYFPVSVFIFGESGRQSEKDSDITAGVKSEADLSELMQIEALLTCVSRLQAEVMDNFTRMNRMTEQEALIDITRPGTAL